MSDLAAKIRIGPAGWSYDDWKGRVYPASPGRGFDQLAYLASYFDTIEINSSFYRPPAPNMTRSWVRRTESNPNFKFTAKLYQKFTHDRGQATADDERAYKTGIEPLMAAGKLGAVLIQFPWSFKNADEPQAYLEQLLDQFSEYPLVVEVRHGSWNREDVYCLLAERGVGFCNIDQPIFRYDYLYSPEELNPWVDRINAVAEHAKEVYVITNNHFHGKGVANALELKSDITGEKVPVPEPVLQTYPRLSAIAQ
jgi:uncharacterized protein YecE (DUF72 family)